MEKSGKYIRPTEVMGEVVVVKDGVTGAKFKIEFHNDASLALRLYANASSKHIVDLQRNYAGVGPYLNFNDAPKLYRILKAHEDKNKPVQIFFSTEQLAHYLASNASKAKEALAELFDSLLMQEGTEVSINSFSAFGFFVEEVLKDNIVLVPAHKDFPMVMLKKQV